MDLFDRYTNCHLCPRGCGVDRATGVTGVCGETAVCRVASFGPHHGEEPSLSGRRGSGTIFFSGCSCGCFFCQNHQISRQHLGRPFSPEQLLGAALELIEAGVHNLNFVTPDHFWPHIADLGRRLRSAGIDIPCVYNCSGYQKSAGLGDVGRTCDIFLPDFKFADAALADRCARAPDYPEIALNALRKMVNLKGFLEPWDQTGRKTARRGVLVRHLVMPGQIDNSLRVLRLLRTEFGRMLPLSLMSQFRPTPECYRRGSLTRPVTSDEYRRVCDLAEELDFQQVYTQPSFEDTGFSPDFEREQPFEGNQPQRP